MKVKSESEAAQSCPTLSDPMDCSLSGFSVHGIFQARVLEWGAIAFSVFMLLYNHYSTKELYSDLVIGGFQVFTLIDNTSSTFVPFPKNDFIFLGVVVVQS